MFFISVFCIHGFNQGGSYITVGFTVGKNSRLRGLMLFKGQLCVKSSQSCPSSRSETILVSDNIFIIGKFIYVKNLPRRK